MIGCQYKTVAKVLANLLGKVVGSIFSMKHSAIVKGTQILDGSLEITKWYKKKKKQLLVL